jgi:hypothetical protein
MTDQNLPSQNLSPSEPKSQQASPLIPSEPDGVKPTSSKRAAWIYVILLAIIGGIAVYIASNNPVRKKQTALPQSEPTTAPISASPSPISWKTYTNTKHNYSIEYPSGWNVDESSSKTGVEFSSNAKNVVSIYIGQKSGGYDDVSLEEYAKVAATKEIQNHNELVSFKSLITASGTVGYETTWMVQSLGNLQGGSRESAPITYFEIPGDKTNLLRITLSDGEDLDLYEKMLNTVTFTAPINPIPTAAIDENQILETVMRKYISNQHGGDENSYSITVSKINGNYAQGGVSTDDGGGIWFAVKEDGVWKLVWDGNGVVNCSAVSLYPDFPTTMIPLCFDETVQDAVKR